MRYFIGNTKNTDHINELKKVGIELIIEPIAFDIHGKQLEQDWAAMYILNIHYLNMYNDFMNQKFKKISEAQR